MTTPQISLNQNIVSVLNSAAAEGEGIKLPFTAPVIWWKHGNRQMHGLNDPRYYGGWASSFDDFYRAIGEFDAHPTSFVDATYSGKDGDFGVYHSRSIAIAPICTRKRWIKNSDGKGRSHLQQLAMMAIKENERYVPWGPVLLSIKGMSTREFERAMQKFDTATHSARTQVAPNVPALYFWRAVGTFGEKPEFVTVGAGNASSQVTYPDVYLPETITPKHVATWFVGQETAEQMVELSKQAEDWLRDKFWQTRGKDSEPKPELVPAVHNNSVRPEYDPDKTLTEMGDR